MERPQDKSEFEKASAARVAQDKETGVPKKDKKVHSQVKHPAKPLAASSELIGNALKSVYQKTVNEDVPADFMDLLNRLK